MFKKIKLFFLFFLLCILLVSLGCSKKTTEETTRPVNTDTSASILDYKLPGMDKIKVKKDVIYDNDLQLKFDVYYTPYKKDISKTPTVLLVHGMADDVDLKDADMYKSWGKVIAASGFTAITFNWRSSSPMAMDVPSLIKYIRENAKDLNINGEDICIMAFSAGVMKGVTDAIRVNTGYIKKVITYYGQIDESILTINPNVKLPSFFIVMGGQDENFPSDMNDDFIKKAKESGCTVIKEVHPRGGHSFDSLNDDAETKHIIDSTLIFIDDSNNI